MQNTALVTGLEVGVYEVTVLDSVGCSSESTNVFIEDPDGPIFEPLTVIPSTNCGPADGILILPLNDSLIGQPPGFTFNHNVFDPMGVQIFPDMFTTNIFSGLALPEKLHPVRIFLVRTLH